MIASLRRAIQPTEALAVGWSWLFFFSILTAYYVLRPIRDDMGVAGGVANLPLLFLGTLAGMAVANPLFGYLTTHVPRARAVSIAYRWFALNLMLFYVLFRVMPETSAIWTGRVFFVWVAVFNMFAVSMFWSVMTDAFSTEQGKRLFGIIGVAGTVGAITGAALTSGLVGLLGPANLLLLSAVLLEAGSFAARRVLSSSARSAEARTADAPRVTDDSRTGGVGGTAWDGLTRTVSDSYLRGIAVHLMLFTILTTFLYFQQATIVDQAITDRTARTRFFANIDLAVNVICLIVQSFVTGAFIRKAGLTIVLAFLPALSVVGFTLLGLMPTVAMLVAFQVARRSSEFAIARPAREVLFTSVERADRYKAKNFIDTFVYRTGDQIGAWTFTALVAIGLGVTGVSAVGVTLSIVAVGVACWLGLQQRRRTA